MFRKLPLIILNLFCLCAISSAAVTDSSDFESLGKFSGGVNTSLAPHFLPENQHPHIENMYVDKMPESLVTRNGFTLCGSTGILQKINVLFEYVLPSDEREMIVSDSSSVWKTKDCLSYTKLIDQLTVTSRLKILQADGKVWGFNGTNNVFTYNGSSVTVLNGKTYNLGRTPNVFKGEFGAYWLDHVWLGKNSELHYSAKKSTDLIPVEIAPDNENAWPDDHIIYVGKGDGQKITVMFVYKGRLFVSKERTIFIVHGDRHGTYKAQEYVKGIGVISEKDITFVDDILYFTGKPNGIYAFDGSNIKRISDDIATDVDNSVSNTANIVSNVWDDASDFNRGVHFNSTNTAGGHLTVETTGYMNDGFQANFPNEDAYFFTQTTTSSEYTPITASNSKLPGRFEGRLSTIVYRAANTGNTGTCTGGTILNAKFLFKNNATGLESSFNTSFSYSQTMNVIVSTAIGNGIYITPSNISNGDIEWKVALDTTTCDGGLEVRISSIGSLNHGHVVLSTNAGQFLSDISTITTLTLWNTFDTEQNLYGGKIDYYYKTSTSLVNIATQAWIAVSPGAIINSSSTNNFIQWAATLTAVIHSQPPEVVRVDISHNEGNSSLAFPFSAEWASRYWVFLSSDQAGDVYRGYVKALNTHSQPDAFVYFTNFPIFSIGKFAGNLYGGGNGKIFRLDYGTNDNGSAIVSRIRTRPSYLKLPFKDKYLDAILLDAEKNINLIISVGVNFDDGNYIYRSVDLGGVGRTLRHLFQNLQREKGNVMSLDLKSSTIDTPLTLHNLGIFYSDANTWTNRP